MAKNSNIAWTDHTFNPWIGCTKVSPGCENCYAEGLNFRFHEGRNWGKGKPRAKTSAYNWKGPISWNMRAEKTGKRAKVFCASLADWLDPEVNASWLGQLMEVISNTPHLDWQLLTKRPHLFEDRMTFAMRVTEGHPVSDWIEDWVVKGYFPDNVWIGTSVEDNTRAYQRIPKLLNIPAKIRFLSCEPLLENVDLALDLNYDGRPVHEQLDWVICGGESGRGCRPMKEEWAWSLYRQCANYDIAFFMKQMGGYPNKKEDLGDIPMRLRVTRFPKESGYNTNAI